MHHQYISWTRCFRRDPLLQILSKPNLKITIPIVTRRDLVRLLLNPERRMRCTLATILNQASHPNMQVFTFLGQTVVHDETHEYGFHNKNAIYSSGGFLYKV